MPQLQNAVVMIRRDWKKLPNIITAARMLLAVPVAIYVLDQDITLAWIGFGCYVLAVSTDWVDGYIAKMNDGRLASELGKVLDPVADKVINFTALVAVIIRLEDGPVRDQVIIATGIIIIREILVLWAKSQQSLKSASEAARFSMVALTATLVLLMIPVVLPPSLPIHVLWFSVGASCIAGLAYMQSMVAAWIETGQFVVYALTAAVMLLMIPGLSLGAAIIFGIALTSWWAHIRALGKPIME